jgi:hypothetical protein
MKKITHLLFILIIGWCNFAVAQQSTLQRNYPVVDGVVSKILIDSANNRMYLGGNFQGVGQNIKNGTLLDSIQGKGYFHIYEPNASVYQAISDGKNGWYLAGDFTKLGDSARAHIAHIDSNGIPTQKFFDIGFNGLVKDLKLVGDTLLALGNFSTYGKQILTSAGSINNTGDNYVGFPEPSGYYNCAVADGNGGWFLGGSFTKVGNTVRKNLAHINAQGEVTAWNPVTDGVVFTMAVYNNQVYVGGMFSSVNGIARNKLASIDKQLASLTSWNPDIRSDLYTVTKLHLIGNKLYVLHQATGGYGYLKRFNLTTGNMDSWDPQPSGANSGITRLVATNDRLFVGGRFNTLGGVSVNDLAVFNLVTDELISSWQVAVQFNTSLKSITNMQVFNNTLYLTGGFNTINGQTRNYLAAINTADGTTTSWNPNPDAELTSMVVADSSVYVSGSFTNIANTARMYFAKLSLQTGQVKPWSFYTNTTGNLQSNGAKLSVIFSTHPTLLSTNITSQNYFAAINTNTNQLINWNLNFNAAVNCMEVYNNTLFVGGGFTQLNGTTRNRLAAIDLVNGALTSWNPDANNAVYAIAVTPSAVYVGGDFTTVGGQARTKLAALNFNTGATQALSVSINNTVKNILVDGLYLYLNGTFSSVAATARYGFACIDVTGVLTNLTASNMSKVVKVDDKIFALGTGSSSNGYAAITGINNTLNNRASGSINTICKSGNKFYVGGGFSVFNTKANPYLAVCNLTTGDYIPWSIQVSSSYVTSMAILGDNLFVAGSFNSVYSPNGTKSSNFVKINWRTETVSTNWAGSIGGGKVVDIVPYAGKLYVGGLFTNIGGRTIANLAELDTADVVGIAPTATAWNPGANNAVYSLHVIDNTVYVGGSFGIIGGQLRSRLAAIYRTTGLATSWNPTVNGDVNKIVPYHETLLVGGAFTQIGAQTRNYLGAVDTSTALASNWDPNLNDVVTSIALLNNEVWVGGNFTTVGTQSVNNLIALNPISGAANQYGIYSAKVNTLTSALNRKLFVATSATLTTVSDGKNYAQLFGGFNLGCFGVNPLSVVKSTQAITCIGSAIKLTTPPVRTNYQWYRNGFPVSNATDTTLIVTQPGSYQLKSMDLGGCVDTSTNVQVLFNPVPSLPVINGANKVLQNTATSYKIVPNTSSIYQWGVLNGVISTPKNDSICTFLWPNLGVGKVKLHETNQFGCSDSAEFEVMISSDTILAITDTVRINSYAQVVGIPVLSNIVWTSSVNKNWLSVLNNSDSVFVQVTENLTLNPRVAEVAVMAGSKRVVSQLIQDGKTNGLPENKVNTFKLYPNPNAGSFTVENPSTEQLTVTVFDLLGKQHAQQIIDAHSNQTLTLDVAPGMYLVKLVGNNHQQTIRLVIQ